MKEPNFPFLDYEAVGLLLQYAEQFSVPYPALCFARRYIKAKGDLHLVWFEGFDMIVRRDCELKRLQKLGGIDEEISGNGPSKEQLESICYGYFGDIGSVLEWVATNLSIRLGSGGFL